MRYYKNNIAQIVKDVKLAKNEITNEFLRSLSKKNIKNIASIIVTDISPIVRYIGYGSWKIGRTK